MTDSMKFGPEWLRNLSTDSANASLGNSVGSVSGNSSSNINSVLPTGGNNCHANSSSTTPLTGQQRNMFPQFRYGREELLSLFDKNCNLPEIFPGNKKLFVDKIQVPLALTPSTDEEVFSQISAPLAPRPMWMRRSPVGFPSTARGSGRGSNSVDRGRMRGKPVYHSIYQRPGTMFETDDMRPSVKQTDRSWTERNGAGDTAGTGSSAYVSGGVAVDWNGTQSSSPRKEFSSHSRNMENWRKNRVEDGTGDPCVIIGTDGWRGASNYSTNHRWVRSSSWRDDETVTTSSTDIYGANGLSVQRSFSAICTSASERGSGYGGSAVSKSSSTTLAGGIIDGSSQIVSRQTSKSDLTSGSGRNQWATAHSDLVDDLPEWAMENPSDSGGTFDASGAFHGSLEEEVLTESKEYVSPCKQTTIASIECSPTAKLITAEDNMIKDDQGEENKPRLSTDKYISSPIKKRPKDTSTNENIQAGSSNDDQFEIQGEIRQDDLYEAANETKPTSINLNITETNTMEPSITPVDGISQKPTDLPFPKQKSRLNLQDTNSHSDLSDRMQEVADDMVEKLIMEDDSVASGNIDTSKSTKSSRVPSATGNLNMANSFVSPVVAAIMKQQQQCHQISPNLMAAPSSLQSLGANHKVLPLYGGGLVMDHATMQQHHLQQQELAAASDAVSLDTGMTTAATADLWYYRDPQSKVQGPFNAIEMTEWYRAGYFDENLFVRRVCDRYFRALGDLIKLCHGNMPFTHTHLIPLSQDNVSMVSENEVEVRTVRDKVQDGINDFGLKLQQQQREDLKGNVTAAADSLSAAVKSLIIPVDMTHMLDMHFQMLQEQYLRHQEAMIIAEYSTKDGFQNLTPSEKDALVHQKMQLLGLPEYLTSLAGLNNSLSSVNPSAANQLYDLIAECSKKGQHFNPGAPRQQDQTQQDIANLFLDRNDFGLNVQKQQPSKPFSNAPFCENGSSTVSGNPRGSDEIPSSGLINDFNFRMMMLNNNINPHQSKQAKTPTTAYDALASANNLLPQQQLISAASQSPVLQMWMPELPVANSVQPLDFLSRQMPNQETTNQWAGNPLVSMPNTDMTSSASMPFIGTPKTAPASMWDVPNQFHSNALHFDVQPPAQLKSAQAQRIKGTKDENPDEDIADDEKISDNSQKVCAEINKDEVKSVSSVKLITSTKLHKDQSDKHEAQASNSKRANNKPQLPQVTKKEGKDDTSTAKKQTDEDRRREIIEDRRRQKEEKKRQQAEEEKRRLELIEEEKLHQQLEEKERQQQIQSQRRKAMLGTTPNASNSLNAKTSRDLRIHSSIAPWSLQNIGVVSSSGPSLAEIQKAERRERRADQQRQTEILEKQMRVNTLAAAESNEAFLKWNSAPIPVKNFAEIQAEEARRLAAEQLEHQRRKEQEQSVALCANIVGGAARNIGSSVSSNNISNIWSGPKAWASNSNAGFWEEPVKFNATAVASNNSLLSSAGGVVNTGTKLPPVATPQKNQPSSNVTVSSNRNITKSTAGLNTVSLSSNTRNNLSSNSKQGSKQPQKSSATANTDKKGGTTKNNNTNITSNNGCSNSFNKNEEYQNEFTDWCVKSLSRMNAKVDVPTFVTFLQDLESPYEVKDYVRMYLGENREYTEFSKQFLERRSKYKNLQREQNAHNDDMCKPAPAITPSGNDSLDNKGKQKKIKKNKMTKLDARILGFSVTAAEGRINVGDRDYVDGP